MTGRSWGAEGLGEVTHMMASPRREAEPGAEVLREGQGTVTVFPAGPGTLAGTLSSPSCMKWRQWAGWGTSHPRVLENGCPPLPVPGPH